MTTELRFLEHRLAVTLHLEAPATRWNHLDLRARERVPDLGRQTGGPWLVASNGAVLDRDRHRPHPALGATSSGRQLGRAGEILAAVARARSPRTTCRRNRVSVRAGRQRDSRAAG